jgi:uncharacterized protein DUF4239
MNYPAVALMVLGSGLLAGALSWTTRKFVRIEALRRHHEIGSAVFLQLGVVFAVLLAFVFSEVWSEYNTAANAINEECGNLHGAAILASVLPPAQRDAVGRAMLAYLTAVADTEWSSMERQRASPETRRQFDKMMADIANLELQEPRQEAARSEMLSLLGVAHQYRETRLFQMTQSVPPLLWVLLISLGAVLVGFLLCFGIENIWSQVVFTGIFAASIAFVLVLVHLLDFPFEGALRLAPADFLSTREEIATTLEGT